MAGLAFCALCVCFGGCCAWRQTLRDKVVAEPSGEEQSEFAAGATRKVHDSSAEGLRGAATSSSCEEALAAALQAAEPPNAGEVKEELPLTTAAEEAACSPQVLVEVPAYPPSLLPRSLLPAVPEAPEAPPATSLSHAAAHDATLKLAVASDDDDCDHSAAGAALEVPQPAEGEVETRSKEWDTTPWHQTLRDTLRLALPPLRELPPPSPPPPSPKSVVWPETMDCCDRQVSSQVHKLNAAAAAAVPPLLHLWKALSHASELNGTEASMHQVADEELVAVAASMQRDEEREREEDAASLVCETVVETVHAGSLAGEAVARHGAQDALAQVLSAAMGAGGGTTLFVPALPGQPALEASTPPEWRDVTPIGSTRKPLGAASQDHSTASPQEQADPETFAADAASDSGEAAPLQALQSSA